MKLDDGATLASVMYVLRSVELDATARDGIGRRNGSSEGNYTRREDLVPRYYTWSANIAVLTGIGS